MALLLKMPASDMLIHGMLSWLHGHPIIGGLYSDNPVAQLRQESELSSFKAVMNLSVSCRRLEAVF
jgi:hypothetical protein